MIVASTYRTLVLVTGQGVTLESFDASCVEHVSTAEKTNRPGPEGHQANGALLFLPVDPFDFN